MIVTSMRGERVLILGGAGFIGSNLAAECLALGASVTIFDALEPQSGGNIANLSDITSDVALVQHDIRSAERVAAAVRDHSLIFNCAALTSHPGSMRDPLANIDVNCTGVINVLEAIRHHNRDARFVQVGTSSQTGVMHVAPIDEWHAEFPLDIYSANKTVGEKYTLIYGRAYDMRTTVVRLANTYGPRACIRSPEFGFMNYFVGLALQNKALTVFGEGQQRRNISFVRDAVSALLTAGTSDAANGHVFFATANEQLTVRTVAESIASVIGGSVQFVEWPADRAAIEIGDAEISNQKMRTRLNWAPQYSLEDGLKLTRDYFASRLESYV